MSNINHIKRKAGEPESSPFGVMKWLFAILSVSFATLAYYFANQWAPQASSGERLTLGASIALFVWLLRHARLIPPQDPLSRLRAPWDQQTRRLALMVSFAIFAGSIWNLSAILTKPVSTLEPQRVLSYAPLQSGYYHINGTPKIEDPPYRWVLDGAAQAEDEWVDQTAPYLIPVQEFKGQLLLISDRPLTQALDQVTGRLLSSHETAQGSFLSYRSYMGLARESVIYLFELRGVRWFDLKATLLCIWSFLLLIGVWSTASKDPSNESALLYIPPELLGSFEAEDHIEENELDKDSEVPERNLMEARSDDESQVSDPYIN